MKKTSRANKGQFSIIAALLVSTILVMAVISTYSMVRYNTLQDSPKVLTAIGEMNTDIKRILDFTVGYYGSILKVTGNSEYAKQLTTRYLYSGLVNVARSHPEWNPSFELEPNSPQVSTRWYMPDSCSTGNINVTYSLGALGIYGVTYETFSALNVEMLESSPGIARINVTCDNSEPELGLGNENFWFYNYTDDSTWELVNPTDIIISSNGVYNVTLPSGINPDAYSVQVEDSRGLIVPTFYSQASVASGSRIPHYTYSFDWESTGMFEIYDSLNTDIFAIELLQNGTLKWLGQPLELTTNERPIPPVSIKAFHVNATIDGNNQEIPFQVEDWSSDYMVPLGLASNTSILNNNKMLVFLVDNPNLVDNPVSDITLWWDGNDTVIQTPYAWKNVYFNDDPNHPSYGLLNNSRLELNVHNFWIESAIVGESVSCTAEFLRVNNELPTYGDQLAYVIYNGTVRDIIQQEAEYQGGVQGCPNFYTQAVLTLPANANYYTLALRTIFVDSSDVTEIRNLNDLSILQLSIDPTDSATGECITENGLNATGFSTISLLDGTFYNSTDWEHHWSEFLIGNSGAGVMFSNSSNFNLYAFDSAVTKTGALVVEKQYSDTRGYIEVNPVERFSVEFDEPLEITWYGAVVTFDGEPIYRSSDDVGLWVMVEHPPTVTVE